MAPRIHREDQYGAYETCPYCGWEQNVGPMSNGPHADYRLHAPSLKRVSLPKDREKARARAARARKRRAMEVKVMDVRATQVTGQDPKR